MKTIVGMTVYTAKETAELLHVSERTIRNYIKRGNLKAQKVGGDWAITEENIKAFLNGVKTA